MARKSVGIMLLSLVLFALGAPAMATPDCDSACRKDLRDKVIRDLRALNEGWVMA